MVLKIIVGSIGGLFFFVFVLWLVRSERKKNRFSPFTENMLRSPGYSLTQKLQDLSDDLVLPAAFLMITPLIYSVLFFDENLVVQLSGLPLVLGVMGYSFYKLKKLFINIQKNKLGLYGETYTGQELNYLMQKGAWVYHDIPYKYGNIDHLVISKAGVFAVETKAVRKPMSKSGGRDARVLITRNEIVFPHVTTSDPIKQVEQHASYLSKVLSEKLGFQCPVFQVISLPGWYVEKADKDAKNGFLVINPKRGRGLEPYINEKERIGKQDLARLVAVIEELARSVEARSNITDPDAKNYYSFLLDRKNKETKL